MYVICPFSLVAYFIFVFNFCHFDYYVSQCVPPWVYPAWDSLCFLGLVDYFLSHVREIFEEIENFEEIFWIPPSVLSFSVCLFFIFSRSLVNIILQLLHCFPEILEHLHYHYSEFFFWKLSISI